MSKSKYKITIAEAATKGARLDEGGAAARAWCVIRIDTTTGDKVTAAQIVAESAANAAGDRDRARAVKDMSRNWGGVYARRSAAVVAAAKAAADLSLTGDNYLVGDYYLDRRLDVDAATSAEEGYIRAAADRIAAARARRLERMTPDQRAAAELRASIKAIKARAAEEIAAIKAKAAA